MDLIGEYFARVERQLIAGLYAASEMGATRYIEAVTRVVEEPNDNLNFPGPHSSPNEFPNQETGQGAANVDWGVNEETLIGGFGVRGPEEGTDLNDDGYAGGMHLYFLSHGVHWVTGLPFARLGMDDIFIFYIQDIRAAFIEAARNAA